MSFKTVCLSVLLLFVSLPEFSFAGGGGGVIRTINYREVAECQLTAGRLQLNTETQIIDGWDYPYLVLRISSPNGFIRAETSLKNEFFLEKNPYKGAKVTKWGVSFINSQGYSSSAHLTLNVLFDGTTEGSILLLDTNNQEILSQKIKSCWVK